MSRKWCLNCEQFIEPKKGFSWLGFLFFNLLYVLYYLFKTRRCPICNGTNFTETNPKASKKLE